MSDGWIEAAIERNGGQTVTEVADERDRYKQALAEILMTRHDSMPWVRRCPLACMGDEFALPEFVQHADDCVWVAARGDNQ